MKAFIAFAACFHSNFVRVLTSVSTIDAANNRSCDETQGKHNDYQLDPTSVVGYLCKQRTRQNNFEPLKS